MKTECGCGCGQEADWGEPAKTIRSIAGFNRLNEAMEKINKEHDKTFKRLGRSELPTEKEVAVSDLSRLIDQVASLRSKLIKANKKSNARRNTIKQLQRKVAELKLELITAKANTKSIWTSLWESKSEIGQ